MTKPFSAHPTRAAMAVVIVMLAGCGENSKPGQPTSFNEKASAVCARLKPSVRAIAHPTSDDPKKTAEYVRKALPIVREQLSQIEALGGEGRMSEESKSFLRLGDAAVRRMSDVAETDDVSSKELVGKLRLLGTAIGEGDAAARRAKIPACAN